MSKFAKLVRSVPLLDYEIERGGDGRTVVAYAATFDDPYEVVDFDGHYDEIINRTAFNRELSRGFDSVQVLYNHGRTIAGESSSEFSLPIAKAVEVKAEPKGLLTRSRYMKSALADQVLELWREGAIRAQSFRGNIYQSAPPRSGPNGRPVIERMILGLTDYGPAPFAVNIGAELVAIRSSLIDERLEALADLSPEERADLARRLTLPGPPDNSAPDGAPRVEATEEPDPETVPPVEEPDDPGSSIEVLSIEAAQRRRRS